MLLRPARRSDADRVAELCAQLGYGVDAASVAARLPRYLDRADQRFVVAELGGRLAGWIHLVIQDSVDTGRFVVVAGLVVDVLERGRGVGRALMQEAERWATEQQCDVVRLSSSSGRTAAHRFYERLGYTRIKTQFAFAKALGAGAEASLRALVPRIDSE